MMGHMSDKGLKIFAICMVVVAVTVLVLPSIMYLQALNAQEQDTKRQLEIEILILESENAQLREMITIIQGQQWQRLDDWLDRWQVLEMDASAYAPFDNQSGICNDGNPFTATGTLPSEGTFAVNPELIPYHSRMYILGEGWGQALDTGGALRAEDLELPRVDIFRRSYAEAVSFGRQRVWVVVER